MWTRFADMHSGGKMRTVFSAIYIEQPGQQAIETFSSLFSNPYHVTCKCCGADYDIMEIGEVLDEFKEISYYGDRIFKLSKEDLDA